MIKLVCVIVMLVCNLAILTSFMMSAKIQKEALNSIMSDFKRLLGIDILENEAVMEDDEEDE